MSTGDKFELGLLGAGRMGMTHLQALRASEKVAVTAVVEPRPEVSEKLAGEGLRTYGSVADLLQDNAVDGVLVAVPTDQHRQVVEEVCLAGKPILCEKPCGLDSQQAGDCVQLAQKAGVAFQVAYWRRYVPALVELRERVLGGAFGELVAVHASQWDAAPPSASFLQHSGGLFVDMGVHDYDQMRWLTGCELSSVKAVVSGSPVAQNGEPDCGQAVARLSNGGTAVVSLGRWHPAGDMCRVEVFGTKATTLTEFLPPVGGDEIFASALRAQAEDFAELVRTGNGRGATARDAVAALELAEASQASAQGQGRP